MEGTDDGRSGGPNIQESSDEAWDPKRGPEELLAGTQELGTHHSAHHQAGLQSAPHRQAGIAPSGRSKAPQPLSDREIISGVHGMSISSTPSLSQNWPEQQSDTGLVHGYDPDTQVQSSIQKADPEIVTPPEFRAEGIVSHSRLLGTESGNSEKLDPSFTIRPKRFFSIGRVFKVLWAEPAGGNATVITRNTFENLLGERVHSKVRWFVVIRDGSNYCGALPIATYGGQGVAKSGVVKSEHGIIYTGRIAPRPDKAELTTKPNEEGMRSEPIQVDPDSPLDRLDPKSRINFAAVSTVHHNIKVKSMGKVNRNSIKVLQQHFQNVWFAPRAGSSRAPYLPDNQSSSANMTMSGQAGKRDTKAGDDRNAEGGALRKLSGGDERGDEGVGNEM
ncbi:hypothetical protein Q7P35_005117 [Cladosporium inversicolor]